MRLVCRSDPVPLGMAMHTKFVPQTCVKPYRSSRPRRDRRQTTAAPMLVYGTNWHRYRTWRSKYCCRRFAGLGEKRSARPMTCVIDDCGERVSEVAAISHELGAVVSLGGSAQLFPPRGLHPSLLTSPPSPDRLIPAAAFHAPWKFQPMRN